MNKQKIKPMVLATMMVLSPLASGNVAHAQETDSSIELHQDQTETNDVDETDIDKEEKDVDSKETSLEEEKVDEQTLEK